MANRPVSIADALRRPCIADNSVLSPLVQTGSAYILDGLLEEPVFLGPVVLDASEVLLPGFPHLTARPSSELLRPLHVHGPRYDQYRARVPHITAFAQASGIHWQQVWPSAAEQRLTDQLATRAVREQVKATCPDVSLAAPLDAGEVEALAIAATRQWTILVDDQAAAAVARFLFAHVRPIRLCALLAHAADQGVVTCPQASALYEDMKRELGLRSTFRIQCDPPRCVP